MLSASYSGTDRYSRIIGAPVLFTYWMDATSKPLRCRSVHLTQGTRFSDAYQQRDCIGAFCAHIQGRRFQSRFAGP